MTKKVGIRAPLAVEVRGLVKRFGDVTAVDGLDLTVAPGECVGLLGPNGAGKTTTVEILEGLQAPSEGEVRLLGLCWETDKRELRARVGISLQETQFHGRLSVQETLALFRSLHPRGLSVEEALGLVQLEEKRKAHVRTLSGGQRQRLALAVAVVGEPDILFLDEPSTGLDPQTRRKLWQVLQGLKARGCTIVLTTHYMEEAHALCDRVFFVDRGRVVAQGAPSELVASLGGEQVIEFMASQPLAPQALAHIPTLVSTRMRGTGCMLTVKELHRAIPELLEVVRTNRATLQHLSTRQATLDDVFLNMTGHGLREECAT